ITGYLVLRSLGSAPPIELGVVPSTALLFDDLTAIPGQTYSYVVKARFTIVGSAPAEAVYSMGSNPDTGIRVP
ncbi:MAG: hypothetical protein ACKO3H_01020, partial [Verrucomicrobiota bacterium]